MAMNVFIHEWNWTLSVYIKPHNWLLSPLYRLLFCCIKLALKLVDLSGILRDSSHVEWSIPGAIHIHQPNGGAKVLKILWHHCKWQT